jgi:hypothetical protein
VCCISIKGFFTRKWFARARASPNLPEHADAVLQEGGSPGRRRAARLDLRGRVHDRRAFATGALLNCFIGLLQFGATTADGSKPAKAVCFQGGQINFKRFLSENS